MANAGTTPYNSIYSLIKAGSVPPAPTSEPKKGPCCLHGQVCPNQEGDEESSPYVNLMTPEKAKPPVIASGEESRREKNLRILTRGMKTLQLGEESDRHKKSHNKKSKKVEKLLSVDLVSSMGNGQSVKKYKDIKERTKKNKKKKKKREMSPDLIRTYGSTSESKKSLEKSRSTTTKERKSRDKSKKSGKKSHSRLDKIVKEKVLSSSYLGVRTWKEAEEDVSELADFRLYHRMDMVFLNELEPNLPLFIVYKCSSGKYKHYRIRQTPGAGNTMTYMVEHGQMNVESHVSLEHLVRFYQTQFIPHETKGQPMVDAFPCWSDSN